MVSVCCVPNVQYMNENIFKSDLKAVCIRYANVNGLVNGFIM